ncbi:MAG: transglutaminase family protein [Candidatus Heimdallarchaeota archaeon]
MNEFLQSSRSIDFHTPNIQEKALELTQGAISEEEKAKKLFYYVRDAIKYRVTKGLPARGDFKASKTLEQPESFCIPKAILLAALARSVSIPARLRFANIRNLLLPSSVLEAIGSDVMLYHGYTELFLNGKWVKVNPAFDRDLCERHDFFPVDFSGSSDALFRQHDRKGRVHFEYLKDHGFFADFTDELYQQIISSWIEFYGSRRK